MRTLPTLLIAASAVIFCFSGVAGAADAGREKRINQNTKWLCYYGDDRRVLDVEGFDLLILETEGVGEIDAGDKRGRICVGYMSVGEAENNRWFWPDIAKKDWIHATNPDWPDSRLVDPRSEEWQRLIVEEVAQAIMDLGYDGFILDNVDTPETLLKADAGRFAGADDAMVELITKLRARYPEAVIIANGGFTIVPKVADAVDAMMYEGTQSTWRENDDGGYSYAQISPKTRAWLKPRLNRIKSANIPILALEYTDLGDKAEIKKIEEAARKAGTNPFVSIRALDWFPGMENLPPSEERENGDDE